MILRVELSLSNGSSTSTYIGTLAEVMNGYVDASISSFRPTLERLKLTDFSQTLVESKLTIVTRTPAKSDTVSYITRKDIFNISTLKVFLLVFSQTLK